MNGSSLYYNTVQGINGGTGTGGGIDNSGVLTLNNSTISHNTANGGNVAGGGAGDGDGSGIYSTGTLTLNNSTVSNNQATGGSGGSMDGAGNGGGIDTSGTALVLLR